MFSPGGLFFVHMAVRSLIFDTETTGLPRDKNMPANLLEGNWPDLVSLSWKVYERGVCITTHSFIIEPIGWTIPLEATRIHGISQEVAMSTGLPLGNVMKLFCKDIARCTTIIAHNLSFDKQVILNALRWRLREKTVEWSPLADVCTGILSTNELKLQFNGRTTYASYKMPSLKELYSATFAKSDPPGAHNSLRDVEVLEEIVRARWPARLSE